MSEAAERLARAHFAALADLADEAIDPVEAALWVAAEEYPGLDVPAELQRLEALAELAAPRLETASGDAERIARLCHFLHEDQGFTGNRSEYYDPRNSYLNEVLERRSGIPITLALVYMAVGRPLGLDVRGIAFPGHFLVKCVGDHSVVVDPFSGVALDADECQRRLDTAVGAGSQLLPEVHLRAATTREILVRLLSNLKHIYAGAQDLERTLACCDRILLLAPEALQEYRDRAQLYTHLDCFAAAAGDLDRFLELAPEDPETSEVRAQRDALRARVTLH